MDTFKDLIDLYYKEEKYTKTNVGKNRILVNRDGCNLIIPNDNKEEHGIYLIESIQGHDCYSYNNLSTHIYHIIEGEGEFIVEDKAFPVYKGNSIKINPNEIFYYSGKMLMILEMFPDFNEEHNFIVKKVIYEEENIIHKNIKRRKKA